MDAKRIYRYEKAYIKGANKISSQLGRATTTEKKYEIYTQLFDYVYKYWKFLNNNALLSLRKHNTRVCLVMSIRDLVVRRRVDLAVKLFRRHDFGLTCEECFC